MVRRRGIFVREGGLNSRAQVVMRAALAQPIAALAQLVEHRIRNAGVVGSNPIGGTIFQSIPRTPGPAVSTMIIGLAPSGVW